MTSSRLSLPTDILSTHFDTESNIFSKPRATYRVQPLVSPAPVSEQDYGHEVLEMTTFHNTAPPQMASQGPAEATAWTMAERSEWIAIAACCGCMFMGGWNDASTGPLLPAIQNHYNIDFVVVSMLFVSSCIGFIMAAVMNSVALQNAQSNTFIAQLPNNASTKMGLLHASYGMGAFIAPLIATQFAQLPRWSFYYMTSLGVALLNALSLFSAFKLRRLHGVNEPNLSASQSEESKYKGILSSRAVQLIALFIWVYVGTEVTIGGWIVTFIIEVRGGGASAGYISSGFFGGLMLGRVVLLWINKKVGERRVVYIYGLLAIGLELVVWLVPDVIGNALAVAVVGLFLGPMYPIAMNITSSVIPRRILTGSIGWIASFGQAGSAVFPFITGVFAQKYGVKVLQPLLVGTLATLIVLWSMVPSGPRRRGE
ncbi:tetracycline resistance protein [Rhizoctonia solani]|uniref:Tetracycline resistance protein n=1 Tax=Rhizoctonia solani TaxID=456999 RepID=A0A8H7HA33_9AGAM|nr:tetracycline resistance protein [Rhizoctonia solani]